MDVFATLLLALVVGVAGGAFTWRRVKGRATTSRTLASAPAYRRIAVVIRYFFW